MFAVCAGFCAITIKAVAPGPGTSPTITLLSRPTSSTSPTYRWTSWKVSRSPSSLWNSWWAFFRPIPRHTCLRLGKTWWLTLIRQLSTFIRQILRWVPRSLLPILQRIGLTFLTGEPLQRQLSSRIPSETNSHPPKWLLNQFITHSGEITHQGEACFHHFHLRHRYLHVVRFIDCKKIENWLSTVSSVFFAASLSLSIDSLFIVWCKSLPIKLFLLWNVCENDIYCNFY